jgi:drug/metabolite transporter (DMT)-like permease
VASGWLDAGANMVLLVAVRHDLLSVVAPLAALYPAATVLLARAVLRERVTRRRTIGLLVALAGLAVIGSR